MFRWNLISVIFVFISNVNCQLIDLDYFPKHYRNLKKSEKSLRASNSNHNDDLSVGDSCGGLFRERQVIIQSPRYPNFYPKNIHCEYKLYSPFVCTNEFHIQFLDFQLESSLTCSKDRLSIGNDETLCGQVIGIMKYKAINGFLQINFTTDATIENKGFKLLVSRLPCTIADNEIEIDFNENHSSTVVASSITTIGPYTNDVPTKEILLSTSAAVDREQQQQQHLPSIPKKPFHVENVPITSIYKPLYLRQTQHNGWLPNQVPHINSIISTRTLPSCCINVYNQKRFYIISPGFPNSFDHYNDCLYFIERSHSNICRLRIELKYFHLGNWQNRQCKQTFIEIDGQRFCGCKTGFVYYSHWSSTPKSIRFSNVAGFRGEIQGFVLDIFQEECPIRLSHSAIQWQPQNYQHSIDDPKRCSANFLSWILFNSNHALLAQSVCIRNNMNMNNNNNNRFGK